MPWLSKNAKIVESEFPTPGRLAAIWTPDVMIQPDGKAVRGFGGRFYFYNAMNEAVPVDGQLVVYAYDDTDKSQTNQVPSRKYAFTPEQFTAHFSESSLGASYSIWLSWDEAGGDEKAVSLMPVFTTTSGHVVMGQQALNVLPGKHDEQLVKSPWGKLGIAQTQMTSTAQARTAVVGAEYQQHLNNHQPALQGFGRQPQTSQPTTNQAGGGTVQNAETRNIIRTTTIALPRTLKARLHEPQASQPSNVNPNTANPNTVPTIQQTSLWMPGTSQQPTSPEFLAAQRAASGPVNALAAGGSPGPLRSASPTAHFGQPQPQAQASPDGQQDPGYERNQPNPSERRSALPWLYRRNLPPSNPATSSNAGRTRG